MKTYKFYVEVVIREKGHPKALFFFQRNPLPFPHPSTQKAAIYHRQLPISS